MSKRKYPGCDVIVASVVPSTPQSPPFGHFLHEEPLLSLTFNAVEVVGKKVPERHSGHAEEPSSEEVPSAHATHETAPCPAAYFAASQASGR